MRANLSYQEALYDAAVERYNGSLLHAVQEVADTLTRWREIDERLAEQQQTVADAAEAERLADSLNRTGLNDRNELMLARLEEHQQCFRLATLEGEHFKPPCKSLRRWAVAIRKQRLKLNKTSMQNKIRPRKLYINAIAG